MKGLFRKYWWLLIILIVLPGIINLCYYFPAIDAIFLEPQKWTIFWGSYIGAIVSTLVTLFVLFKQLEQNHSENEYNRKLQINILDYQRRVEWLNIFTPKLMDYFKSFNWNEWIFIREDIIKHKNRENIRQRLRALSDNINILDADVHAWLPNALDEKEKLFVKKIDYYSGEFWALADDVDWYVFEDFFTKTQNGLSKNDIENIVKKEYAPRHFMSQSLKMGQLIHDFQYDINKHHKDIISSRINDALKRFSYETMRKDIEDFILYEKEKAEAILKNN